MTIAMSDSTTIMNDLAPHIHTQLDKDLQFLSSLPFNTKAALILSNVISGSEPAYANTPWPIDQTFTSAMICEELLRSNQELRKIMEKAHRSGQYTEIRKRRELPSTLTVALLTICECSLVEFHPHQRVSGDPITHRWLIRFGAVNDFFIYFLVSDRHPATPSQSMPTRSFPNSPKTFSVTEEQIENKFDERLRNKLRWYLEADVNLPLWEPPDSLDDESRRHVTQLKLPGPH